MNCGEAAERIAESARQRAAPGEGLARHLAECARCAARWEREAELERGFGALRSAVSGLRSSGAARERLIREAEARRPAARWRWAGIAAAAALAIGLALSRHPAPAPSGAGAEIASEEAFAESDFVAVPYAPPLAEGERVEVVRTELSAAALARMGFVAQAEYAGDVTADLMIGEDGLPRAVRVQN